MSKRQLLLSDSERDGNNKKKTKTNIDIIQDNCIIRVIFKASKTKII
jgi:hypothetical protein